MLSRPTLLRKKTSEMGLDKDAELRKLQEEIRREREKVERLQREVNERVAREAKAKQGKGG